MILLTMFSVILFSMPMKLLSTQKCGWASDFWWAARVGFRPRRNWIEVGSGMLISIIPVTLGAIYDKVDGSVHE